MPTTQIYTLSLHDALPILKRLVPEPIKEKLVKKIPLGRFGLIKDIEHAADFLCSDAASFINGAVLVVDGRSEEHTSELQSHSDLVCRLLLEKKNSNNRQIR